MLSTKPFKCPDFLLTKAQKGNPIRTAVVNPITISSMQGVKWSYDKSIIEPIFIGDPKHIIDCAKELNWNIRNFDFHESSDDKDSADKASELASNGMAFAIMKGYIDTGILLKSILNKKMNLVKNGFLSHIFHMTIEGSNKALMITDCVLNVSPNQMVKRDILRNAIFFAKKAFI